MSLFRVILSHNAQKLPTKQFQNSMIDQASDEDIRTFVSIRIDEQQWELSISAWKPEEHLHDDMSVPESLPTEFNQLLQTNSVLTFLNHLKTHHCITNEVIENLKSWVVNCHPQIADHAFTLGGEARRLTTRCATKRKDPSEEDMQKKLARLETTLSANPQQSSNPSPSSASLIWERTEKPTDQPANTKVATPNLTT